MTPNEAYRVIRTFVRDAQKLQREADQLEDALNTINYLLEKTHAEHPNPDDNRRI